MRRGGERRLMPDDIREEIPGNRLPPGEDLVARDVFDVTGARIGRVARWLPAEGAIAVDLSQQGQDALGEPASGVAVPAAWIATVREEGVFLDHAADDLFGPRRGGAPPTRPEDASWADAQRRPWTS